MLSRTFYWHLGHNYFISHLSLYINPIQMGLTGYKLCDGSISDLSSSRIISVWCSDYDGNNNAKIMACSLIQYDEFCEAEVENWVLKTHRSVSTTIDTAVEIHLEDLLYLTTDNCRSTVCSNAWWAFSAWCQNIKLKLQYMWQLKNLENNSILIFTKKFRRKEKMFF